MTKKTISIFLAVLIVLTLAFPVFAESASIPISLGGQFTVTVAQGSNTQTYTFNDTFTADTAGGEVTVSVSGVADGNYITINDIGPKTTATVAPNVGAVSVAILAFQTPTITLSTSTSGGLNYTITNPSNLSSLTYNVAVGSYNFSTNTTSGNIPLSSTIVAGTSYTATVKATINGCNSNTSSPSNSAPAGAAGSTTYPLTANAAPTEGGKVGDINGKSYASGTKVTLSATANSGYKFVNWTTSNGGSFDDSTKSGAVFTMPANAATITANFKKTYDFVITRNEGGKVWDVDGQYYEGEKITVSAAPDSGYLFDNWTSSAGGTFADSKSNRTTFTMPAGETTVTATFKKDPNAASSSDSDSSSVDETGLFELKTNTSEGGNVVINQNRVKEGQQVTIRANAKAGYRFESWSSEGGGSFADAKVAATTFTMPANEVVLTAVFVPDAGNTGSDSNSGNSADSTDGEPSARGGNGLLWLIIAIVGVIGAITAGILLMMNEKKKRYAEDDGFDEYTVDNGLEEDIAESRYSNFADTQELDEPVQKKQKKTPAQKSKKKADAPKKFRADDWDD